MKMKYRKKPVKSTFIKVVNRISLSPHELIIWSASKLHHNSLSCLKCDSRSPITNASDKKLTFLQTCDGELQYILNNTDIQYILNTGKTLKQILKRCWWESFRQCSMMLKKQVKLNIKHYEQILWHYFMAKRSTFRKVATLYLVDITHSIYNIS